MFVKRYVFVALCVVKVCIPTNSTHAENILRHFLQFILLREVDKNHGTTNSISPLLLPNHILLSRNDLKISLYVIAFWFPITIKCFPLSMSCMTYSRNIEKGGFVTTISACFKSPTHSGERKSPSPSKRVRTFFLFLSKYSTSDKSTAPSAFSSVTSVISILYAQGRGI